ncbi:kinase-like protein [Neolentinus lepideus HHB14362 ss-1]|uniref:Kinase-like protein n=1 Tax=Neolentinus lepideus HHB14362 ss-1 TaxID=1314782 RepID=A0A165VMU2_9AGAM|nr:kinase-like protein [Neolentinus lepideus HHB14362 ss-1]
MSVDEPSSEVAVALKGRKHDSADDTTFTVTKQVLPSMQPSGSGAADNEGPVQCDDREGHLIIVPPDIIHERYRTVRLLRQGTHGKVIEAIDTHDGKRVAIKIIRAIQKYRDASEVEVRVLQKLKEHDPNNLNKCIHLLQWFNYHNHICIVYELFGMCIYDFLKENDFEPFPRQHIQSFAKQLLGSVAFLHELHIIHADLRPEIALLVDSDYRTVPVPGEENALPTQKRILNSTEIRLTGFSSAAFEEEHHSTVVSTRLYLAPEIILGLGWSYPCDAFSLGCILVEFYTGVALFQSRNNLEHLAMMEQVTGKMPDHFARAGARSKPEFFKDGAKLDWPKANESEQSNQDVWAWRSLKEIISPTDTLDIHFLDLVRKLLTFDPAQRITVREALNHPFFSVPIVDES